jgi:hypothetical protein
MAVIQISKIQVRRGQTSSTGMPQLSSGEFGWSIDTQELFIGPGSIAEGAPDTNNVKLLTERDLFNNVTLTTQLPYIYKNTPDTTIVTGMDSSNPVIRTLQTKLDDHVSVKDFGAIGDGIADDTIAIQRAINQLYRNPLISSNNNKVNLLFPAGTYLISSTIYVPPYARLIGDGIGNTVIKISSANAIFQTCDSQGNFTSIDDNVRPLLSGGDAPNEILIKGMTITTTNTGAFSLLLLDNASNTVIEKCHFLGHSVYNSIAMQLRGYSSAFTCDNVAVRDCEFTNLQIGIIGDYDMANIKFENNTFNSLLTGIKLATDSYNISKGKTAKINNVQILNNSFNTIDTEAIHVGHPTFVNSTTSVVSSNNYFYDVGNQALNAGGGEDQNYREVIRFATPGNLSIDDRFDRLLQIEERYLPNTISNSIFYPVIVGQATFKRSHTIKFTSGDMQNFIAFPLARSKDNADNFVNFLSQNIEIEYQVSYNNSNNTKRGNISVIVNSNTATMTESYSSSNGDELMLFSSNAPDTTHGIFVMSFENLAFDSGVLTYTYTVSQ